MGHGNSGLMRGTCATGSVRLRHAAAGLAFAMALPASLWAQTPPASDPANPFKAFEQLAKDPQALKKLRQQNADRRAKMEQADHVVMPPRNEPRLSRMPRQLLAPAQLPAYLGSVNAKLLQGLTPAQRSAAATLIAKVRSSAPPASGGAAALAQGGTLAWVMRQPVAAAVLLGQAATEAPSNKQTLSNYAATLTSLGVADLGIPLLMRLDADAPNNSTVLNNLGQAWFSLGAIDEAKKALKRAVLAFARHSEANETLSHILEAEGDAAGAQDALERSIDGGYSEKKVARLGRMGRAYPQARIGGHIRIPDDPLGLAQFQVPEFCSTAADLPSCKQRSELHQKAAFAAIDKIDKQIAERQATLTPEPATPQVPGERVVFLPLASAAYARMQPLLEQNAKRPIYANAAFYDLLQQVAQAQAPIQDAFGEQSRRDPCGATNGSLASSNAAAKAFFEVTRPATERYINELVYLNQFMQSPQQDELLRLSVKRVFLQFYSGIHGVGDGLGCPEPPPEPGKRKPLADFYDLHCPNIVTFTVPAIGDWTVRCNKMITHLNVNLPEMGVLAGASLRGNLTENLETGVVERGSLELGVNVGVGSGSAGPIAGEVDVSGGVFVTFGPNGVTDVGGRGGVQTTVTNLGELPVVDAGAGVTVSINSGVTVSAPTGSVLNIPVGDAP